MASSYRGNRAGIKDFLANDSGVRSLIQTAVDETLADAENSFPEGFLILSGIVDTDRPQGNVTVVNRSAEAMEAKYGYLARAAASTGFEGPV